jgi:hypothetical protein
MVITMTSAAKAQIDPYGFARLLTAPPPDESTELVKLLTDYS